MCEQPLLALDAAAVSGQRPVRSDHAMTRDDHRNRIRAVGRTDRTNRGRLADATRELAVRDRVAVRKLEQRVPDRQLKWCSARRELEIERLALARKIFVDLIDDRRLECG